MGGPLGGTSGDYTTHQTSRTSRQPQPQPHHPQDAQHPLQQPPTLLHRLLQPHHPGVGFGDNANGGFGGYGSSLASMLDFDVVPSSTRSAFLPSAVSTVSSASVSTSSATTSFAPVNPPTLPPLAVATTTGKTSSMGGAAGSGGNGVCSQSSMRRAEDEAASALATVAAMFGGGSDVEGLNRLAAAAPNQTPSAPPALAQPPPPQPQPQPQPYPMKQPSQPRSPQRQRLPSPPPSPGKPHERAEHNETASSGPLPEGGSGGDDSAGTSRSETVVLLGESKQALPESHPTSQLFRWAVNMGNGSDLAELVKVAHRSTLTADRSLVLLFLFVFPALVLLFGQAK